MANFAEKENVFLKVAKYLIPWKGDNSSEVIRKIIFLGAIVVLIITLSMIFVFKGRVSGENKENEELANLYHGTGVTIDTEKLEQLEKEFPTVQEQFLPLLEINKDVIGWITIGATDPNEKPFIDYVVMQGKDNDYYLTHNYKGENSISGAIFADCRSPITADKRPANIVLYGHNMQSGEIFGKLSRYFNYSYTHSDKTDISYYKNHPTVTFSTLYDTSTYKIFAGMLVNTEDVAGEVFNYHRVHNFKNKSEFDEYCAQVLDRSTFITPDVDLQYGDELITLSTCIYGYNDKADPRWVVFARKVRDGESESVDVDKAFANPSPLFYDMYYSTFGGKWNGRQWPTDIIKGYKH